MVTLVHFFDLDVARFLKPSEEVDGEMVGNLCFAEIFAVLF